MMKKFAWTMAELVVCITVIIIISGVSIKVFKPNTQKGQIYLYAAIKNLEKANMGIMEDYGGEFYPANAKQYDDNNTNDWYCMKMADMLSITGTPNCGESLGTGTANFSFSNGITIYGISRAWQKPDGLGYYYKDILIDIDGGSGLNRIGIDRFPARIFRGYAYDGMLRLANCGNDVIATDLGAAKTVTSPYCTSGAPAQAQNKEFITYDIYRADNANEETTASMVMSTVPTMQADCYVNGGNGLYAKSTCAGAGYTIPAVCAKKDICHECASGGNVCTGGSEATCLQNQAASNPHDVPCFLVLHKPTGGMGLLAGSLLSDIDY